MAQQNSTPRAVAQAGTDRTEFLSGINASEYECTAPAMGANKVDTCVCVFDKHTSANQVMLVLRGGAFAMHNVLSAEEARTLAEALTMAARYAESIALQNTCAMWAATPPDEVAA